MASQPTTAAASDTTPPVQSVEFTQQLNEWSRLAALPRDLVARVDKVAIEALRSDLLRCRAQKGSGVDGSEGGSSSCSSERVDGKLRVAPKQVKKTDNNAWYYVNSKDKVIYLKSAEVQRYTAYGVHVDRVVENGLRGATLDSMY